MPDSRQVNQYSTSPSQPEAIILAAGKGTRMQGDLPKVLHPVADRPMVKWIVQACRDAGVSRCVVVVGYRAQDVQQVLVDEPDCTFVHQHEQLGTGHAVQMAQSLYANGHATDVLVLPGDAPLITADTLRQLVSVHRQASATATVATANLDNPHGYGRVIRHSDGSFQAIVEQKDATEAQQQVHEINTGYYCFRSDQLFPCLTQVSAANAQGEYYLTDVPGLLANAGMTIALLDAVAPREILGVNDTKQLAEADQILRKRLKRTAVEGNQDES